MKMKNIFTVMLLAALFAVSSVYAQSYNYEEMTQEQYNAYLAQWQQRLQTAQKGINEQNTKIDELNKELDNLQTQIDNNWDDIYKLASSDKPNFTAYGEKLQKLKSDANSAVSLSPEEIYAKMNEVDSLQAKVDMLKKDPYSATSEYSAEITNIENTIKQARDKGKAAIPPSYSVTRGDYLWKIAGKSDIYGNPFAWIRIYTSNRDQIKNPDLIYPNQVLSIPRVVGPNEHLVAKGEFLSKIAGDVYGSTFKWQKLYEANKSVISDPNVIYPYQVLKIAR